MSNRKEHLQALLKLYTSDQKIEWNDALIKASYVINNPLQGILMKDIDTNIGNASGTVTYKEDKCIMTYDKSYIDRYVITTSHKQILYTMHYHVDGEIVITESNSNTIVWKGTSSHMPNKHDVIAVRNYLIMANVIDKEDWLVHIRVKDNES